MDPIGVVRRRSVGHGENGPTLEIFQFDPARSGTQPVINQPGLVHLAFEVDDVAKAREEFLAAGGKEYGQLISLPVPGAGTVTLVYLADPEGNLVELQTWRLDVEAKL